MAQQITADGRAEIALIAQKYGGVNQTILTDAWEEGWSCYHMAGHSSDRPYRANTASGEAWTADYEAGIMEDSDMAGDDDGMDS